MTDVVTELRTRRAAAVFAVRDLFLEEWGAAGPGASRHPVCPLEFRVQTTDSAPPRPMPPGWLVDVQQGASGVYVTRGRLIRPDGRRLRPSGSALDLAVTVTGRAYRRMPEPIQMRLVNLDPSQDAPAAQLVPVGIGLHPGFDYPFPGRPMRYAVVRGSVSCASGGVDGAEVTASAVAPRWQDSYVVGPDGQFVFVVATNARPFTVKLTAGIGDRRGAASFTVAGPTQVTVQPVVLN